jgi:hypothetical protein
VHEHELCVDSLTPKQAERAQGGLLSTTYAKPTIEIGVVSTTEPALQFGIDRVGGD